MKAPLATARRQCAYIVLVAIAIAIVLPAVPVAATPTSDIDEKRSEAAAARAQLEDMAVELEIRVEEYAALDEELQRTRRRISETERDLSIALVEEEAARQRLAQRASDIYKSRRLSFVELLLGTTSFSDLIGRLELLARVGGHDALLASEVEAAVARVEATEIALHSRESEQVNLRDRARAKAREIEEGIRGQEAFLADLDAEIERLVREEEERQRRLAEERARRAREAAERRAAAEARQRSAANLRSGREPDGELGEGHPEAVDVALRFLGVRYQWGGTSPDTGFDCSGLVQYCYRQIGIDIPRTSRSQFKAGTHVPADRLDLLLPGDLVFFGKGGDPGRVHHVGIYAGDGTFIHAPQTGDVVKVSSLEERISARADYVGASRL